ncbi:cat eye syndrome critical region protein 2 [Caerostris darwini]|uniref:Cat eye syndrome critical region protein 2 n=1 Tax=Caerostris darwini TaxID=1538125 RepID=A0AAV4NB32_9ARAC|nr:cat eye syndrome critical region protein 2 [Caerostris darwini]
MAENRNTLKLEQEIQQMWEIAAIAQYVSRLYEDLNLPQIEIEELEDGLLGKNEVGRTTVEDLMIRLLKGIYPCTKIGKDDWHGIHMSRVVRKIWKTEERQEENPLSKANASFLKLNIKLKVDILKSLCYLRMDQSDAVNVLKKMDPNSLRVKPLGCDKKGNEYWYFYGLRLYKQEHAGGKVKDIKFRQDEWEKRNRYFQKSIPKKRKNSEEDWDNADDVLMKKNGFLNTEKKSRWSVVCRSVEEWVEFSEKFKISESKFEKKLFNTVTRLLPQLNEIYQAKEKKFQKKLRELKPKPVFTKLGTRRKKNLFSLPANDSCDSDYDSYNECKKNSVKSRAERLEERNGVLHKFSICKGRFSKNVDEQFSKRPRRICRMKYEEKDDDDFIEKSSSNSNYDDNTLMR